MQSPLPPHFHKEDRISEIDIIPDSRIFDVVPDWAAPEGTEVTYVNGADIRRYKMIDGTWQHWSLSSGGASGSSRVSAYRGTSDQALPAVSTETIEFNAVVYDELGEFDESVNHRFTPQEEGYYLVEFQWQWSAAGADGKYKIAQIVDSGGVVARAKEIPGASGFGTVSIGGIFFLQEGNYLQFQAHSEDAVDIIAAPYATYLHIHRLS